MSEKIDKIMAYSSQRSALTNQNAGLIYKCLSIRQKNKAFSGRSV